MQIMGKCIREREQEGSKIIIVDGAGVMADAAASDAFVEMLVELREYGHEIFAGGRSLQMRRIFGCKDRKTQVRLPRARSRTSPPCDVARAS